MSWRKTDVCKSPLPSELKHQRLYKAGTPPWKDTYRKKCKERLVEGRRSLLEQMRMGGSGQKLLASSVEEVLATELNHLQTHHPQSSSHNTPTQAGEESMDELLQMLDEVRQELICEENEAMGHWGKGDRWVKLDRGQMDEWMEDLLLVNEKMEGEERFIACPICLKNTLTTKKGVVHCPCGLRIDTEQDAVTLEMVEGNLRHSSLEHSATCLHPPSYDLLQQPTLSNLLMSCKFCDYLYIII